MSGATAVDADVKRLLHDEYGFNIVRMGPDKVARDARGDMLTGKIKVGLGEIEDHAMASPHWGIRHSLDQRCRNILFLDRDAGGMPEIFLDFMTTKRLKLGKMSYHGLVQVSGADLAWCVGFAKKYHQKNGFEVFAQNQTLAMLGDFVMERGGKDTSAWEWVDEDVKSRPVRRATKSSLEAAFAEARGAPDEPKAVVVLGQEVVPAGEGKRHKALVSECFRAVSRLPKAERYMGAVVDGVMKSGKIEGVSDYASGGGLAELSSIAEWVLEKYKSDPYSALLNHFKGMHHYATIVNHADEKGQYNVSYYNKEEYCWSVATGDMILGELEGMDLGGLPPTSRTSNEMAKKIGSSKSGVLRVKIDEEYAEKRMCMIIGKDGRYFDLVADKIKEIDPEGDYFEDVDVKFDLTDSWLEPVEFLDFLKTRFGKDWEIVLDHLASVFIHNLMLGNKPKMMFLVGKNGTYKSHLIDIMRRIVKASALANMEKLEDPFLEAQLRNKLLATSEEENGEMMKNQAVFKDLITRTSGSVRVMFSDRQVQVFRFPRWIIACNTIPPLAKNDDVESVFVRTNYIRVRDPVDGEPDWRKLIKTTDREKMRAIMMLLLERAAEIVRDPSTMNTQSVEQAREAYGELTSGGLENVLEKYCVRVGHDNTGVLSTWLCNLIREKTDVNLSDSMIVFLLSRKGHEKRSRAWCKPSLVGDKNTYDLASHGDVTVQKTIILGLREKKDGEE